MGLKLAQKKLDPKGSTSGRLKLASQLCRTSLISTLSIVILVLCLVYFDFWVYINPAKTILVRRLASNQALPELNVNAVQARPELLKPYFVKVELTHEHEGSNVPKLTVEIIDPKASPQEHPGQELFMDRADSQQNIDVIQTETQVFSSNIQDVAETELVEKKRESNFVATPSYVGNELDTSSSLDNLSSPAKRPLDQIQNRADQLSQKPGPSRKDRAGRRTSKRQTVLDGSKSSDCNIFEGTWVYDENYPLYRSISCAFADPGFRCEENGRPDTDFVKYRWQPHDCDFPRFDARDMLERLRGSRLVYVGDSIGRNQWESMLCMLSEAVSNKSSIYEVNGEPITKHTGFLSFRFAEFNCTVEYYRSPFLIPQGSPPPNSPVNVSCGLKVDTMDWASPAWKDADILVFNAGHWWTAEKTTKCKLSFLIFKLSRGPAMEACHALRGCYFEEGHAIDMDLDLENAFAKALRTWGRWVEDNVDQNKTSVFFRSYSPAHFVGGTWKTGGHCDKETGPLSREEAAVIVERPWTNDIISKEIRQNMKKNDAVTYLDITPSTNTRADGHASLYWADNNIQKVPSHKQDCSHWCLPGVPDTWNELLFASLRSRGQGVWGEPVRYN